MGIIYKIMESVVENSHELKFNKPYLYTKHDELYEKFGWELVEELETYIRSEEVKGYIV